MARVRNEALAARIAEAGWTQPNAAAAVRRVAEEVGARELAAISRSHISMWILGTRPSGQAPRILCETLTRKLGRPVTLTDIGLPGTAGKESTGGSHWDADTLTALTELGRDDLDMLHRRRVLTDTAYSVAGLAIPHASWWKDAPATAAKHRRASPADVQLHARSPRGNTRWPATGTFAHRNHRRPNQLAISCPRLLGVDGRDLLVTDLDAVDGTPVIDIAPWFADMGPRGPVQEPAWPGEMLENYWRDAESR